MVFLAVGAATPATAGDVRMFNVAPGALGGALVAFGQQAGVSVGLTDPELSRRHSQGASGQFSRRQALRRILAGTGARFIEIDSRTVRVIAVPVAVVRPTIEQGPIEQPPAPARPAVVPDIIVTGSKQRTNLSDYAGTVAILNLDDPRSLGEAAQGTASIVSRLPVLSSTNLGPGRNKIFIRGVADSSFNGSSAATVGQYLGDARLTYNAPDPALNLYDMQRVEVLEGPQGTLYGTGALGGIIRLIPNAPALNENRASMSVASIDVAHGGRGFDSAGMVNLVVQPGRAALRGVIYAADEPGYIDDTMRGLRDINRSKSRGGRAALRIEPENGWSITVGGAIQNIASRDGQYALKELAPLTRRSALAQPFDNDFRLGYATLVKQFGAAELTTTTSLVRHDVDTVFDATVSPAAAPRKYEEQLAIRLLSHETRLSRSSERDSWVVGVSGLIARDSTRRSLGDPSAPIPITGVRNLNREAAIFGQYSRFISSHLTATAGARFSVAQSSGDLLDDANLEVDEPKRTQLRFSPSVALARKFGPRLVAFVHAQSAFRPGLLEVAPSGAGIASQRTKADTLTAVELGLRYGEQQRDPLTFAGSIAGARWTDYQSDLIDGDGLPYTANIGDGRIVSIEAHARWQADPSVAFGASLFLNDSRLTKPSPAFSQADERELPNIPRLGARLAASFRNNLGGDVELAVDGAIRYVGSSRLGIGPPFDVSQGRFFDTFLGARLSHGPIGLSLDVSNIGDVRSNRFAYGNPFSIFDRNQTTPLVPRKIRLGLDFHL